MNYNLWVHIFCNVPTFLSGRGASFEISRMNTAFLKVKHCFLYHLKIATASFLEGYEYLLYTFLRVMNVYYALS